MLGTLSSLVAQDWIYFRDGGKAKVRIIERTKTEIVYQLWDKRNGPVFRVSDHLVKKVESSSGKTFDLDPVAPLNQATGEMQDRKNSLMIDLLAPALGHTSLTYTRWLKVGLTLEITLGYIGLGKDYHARNPYQASTEDIYRNEWGVEQPFTVTHAFSRENKGGGYLRIGPRFHLTQAQGSHVFYLQPEILLSQFEIAGREAYFATPEDIPVITHPYDYSYRQRFTQSGLFLHTGYQMRFERLMLDGKLGVGYVHQNLFWEVDNHLQQPLPYYFDEMYLFNPSFQYTHLFLDTLRYDLAMTFALRVGYLF